MERRQRQREGRTARAAVHPEARAAASAAAAWPPLSTSRRRRGRPAAAAVGHPCTLSLSGDHLAARVCTATNRSSTTAALSPPPTTRPGRAHRRRAAASARHPHPKLVVASSSAAAVPRQADRRAPRSFDADAGGTPCELSLRLLHSRSCILPTGDERRRRRRRRVEPSRLTRDLRELRLVGFGGGVAVAGMAVTGTNAPPPPSAPPATAVASSLILAAATSLPSPSAAVACQRSTAAPPTEDRRTEVKARARLPRAHARPLEAVAQRSMYSKSAEHALRRRRRHLTMSAALTDAHEHHQARRRRAAPGEAEACILRVGLLTEGNASPARRRCGCAP